MAGSAGNFKFRSQKPGVRRQKLAADRRMPDDVKELARTPIGADGRVEGHLPRIILAEDPGHPLSRVKKV